MTTTILICVPVVLALLAGGSAVVADDGPTTVGRGIFRGTWTVANFDVSPPLKDITPIPVDEQGRYGGAMIDPDNDLGGELGPQDADA